MCLRVCYCIRKKMKKIILKSLKKDVRSISQRYGSADPEDPDLDPRKNVTDPQHCLVPC
jgi:hypothetical protein